MKKWEEQQAIKAHQKILAQAKTVYRSSQADETTTTGFGSRPSQTNYSNKISTRVPKGNSPKNKFKSSKTDIKDLPIYKLLRALNL